MKVNSKVLLECLNNTLLAGLCPMVVGSPGVGKSDIAKQLADAYDLKLVDIRLSQMDLTDLCGFPFPNKETGKAEYMPMNIFPLEGDEIPEGYKGWLLLLDEINSAPPSVMAAAYKLILDRMVGAINLHKNVAIIAAGNLSTDKAIVNKMSTALQSRMIHFELTVDYKEWIKWAELNDIDHRIMSFIEFKPELLHKFDPNHNDSTFATPRTWSFASRLIKNKEKIDNVGLVTLAGTLSEGVAREFVGFCDIYAELPNLSEIMKNPSRVKYKDEASINYALSGIVSANLDGNTAENLMKFLIRLPIEFQVISIMSILRKNPAYNNLPDIKQWVRENAESLI